jgi:hypothetical protein
VAHGSANHTEKFHTGIRSSRLSIVEAVYFSLTLETAGAQRLCHCCLRQKLLMRRDCSFVDYASDCWSVENSALVACYRDC